MTAPRHSNERYVSRKARQFTESVIREMTREALKHGAVNLSQGFPDFPAPAEIKRAAAEAINADINQYAITWGARDFRTAIAEKTRWYLGLDVDPETELTVTCGSTEGMIAAMMATVDPNEEVIIFEPFYENYAPDAVLSDARPRYIPLRAPDWSFDRDELRAAVYEHRRDLLVPELERAGFRVFRPDGAYYVMTDISAFGFADDVAFTRHLIQQIGVACVPGSSFYSDPKLGAQQVRFCFCKKDETLHAAAERLQKLRH